MSAGVQGGMTIRSLTIVLAGLLATAACGEAGVAARGAVDEPWGRSFLSVEITESDEPRPLVAGTRITLSFSEDRRLGAHAGCNSMAGDAAVDDGRLDLAVIGDISRLDLVRQVPHLYRGAHVAHQKFTHLTARSIRVESAEPTRVQLDGELAGAAPVTFTVEAGALRIAG